MEQWRQGGCRLLLLFDGAGAGGFAAESLRRRGCAADGLPLFFKRIADAGAERALIADEEALAIGGFVGDEASRSLFEVLPVLIEEIKKARA